MHGNDTRRRTDVALPLARFALAGLLAVVVVGAIAVWLQRSAARDDAIKDATTLAKLAGNGIVAPAATQRLLDGDPGAIAEMDRLVRSKIITKDGGIVRVKIWDANGRIAYSDLHSLINQHFALPQDERDALATGDSEAELTHLSRAENRYDELHGKLLEVYLGIRATTGERLLFELYQEQKSVTDTAEKTFLAFAPALIGALLLLQLLQLPSAYRMARSLHDNRQEREALLLRALAASDTERRRIASDLHDGVVQDLAGTSYALAAAADRIDGEAPDVSEALRDGARQTRRSIRQLRSLLVDIYPPDLHRAGLAAALSDLVAPLEARGVQARVDLPPGLRLEPDAEALMFRTAQEALRNVMAHSAAHRVDVSVILENSHAGLTIADDGRGFTPEVAQAARDDGHLGLRVLADMAQDAGGRLDIDSEPGRGTRVSLEVPVS
jgi:two-component system, NarL family, sensor kinase